MGRRPVQPGAGVRRSLPAEGPSSRAKAIALHAKKLLLRVTTEAMLDHAVHASTISREKAIAFMVDHAFQTRSEAEALWVRVQVAPAQVSADFVGVQAWLALRERAEAIDPSAFNARAFHDAALAHGAPPVHRLPELMGWPGRAAARRSSRSTGR